MAKNRNLNICNPVTTEQMLAEDHVIWSKALDQLLNGCRGETVLSKSVYVLFCCISQSISVFLL